MRLELQPVPGGHFFKGIVFTKRNAREQLEGAARFFYRDGFTIPACQALAMLEEQLTGLGYLTWDECDAVEAEVIGSGILDS